MLLSLLWAAAGGWAFSTLVQPAAAAWSNDPALTVRTLPAIAVGSVACGLPVVWSIGMAARARWVGRVAIVLIAAALGRWLGIGSWRENIGTGLVVLVMPAVIVWLTFGDQAVAAWWRGDAIVRSRPPRELPKGSPRLFVFGTLAGAVAWRLLPHPAPIETVELSTPGAAALPAPGLPGAQIETRPSGPRRLTFPALGIELREISGVELDTNTVYGRPVVEWNFLAARTEPYWLASTEVTRGLYRSHVGAGAPIPGDPDLPHTGVTWWDAVVFCNTLSTAAGLTPVYRIVGDPPASITWDPTAIGFRLPTDAEWVAVGVVRRADGTRRRLDTDCRHANTLDVQGRGTILARWSGCDDGAAALTRVASYLPTRLGLFDQFGNVAEWTWGEVNDDVDFPPGVIAHNLFVGPRSHEYGSGTPVSNAPPATSPRVLTSRLRNARGGSWMEDADDVDLLTTLPLPADAALPQVGFRIALSAPQ